MRSAAEQARPGEAVVLSPACASFDQFRNFVHRGEVFQALVRGVSRRAAMAKKLAFDKVLFTIVVLLMFFGLVMVFSASAGAGAATAASTAS